MVSTGKVYILKLVPKLKTNNSVKLLLFDMKVNSRFLMRLETNGTMQADLLYFQCSPSS